MRKPSPTAERIVAAAERRMREGGFHGFSFRDIAADVGIRSASVHHHFPNKEALAAAVARAYTERHMAALGDPSDPVRAPRELLALYVEQFRQDLLKDRRMCLCGVLAGEASALSPAVAKEVRGFFARNLAWLEVVLARALPGARTDAVRAKARTLAAALEGALLVAHCLGDEAVFEAAAGELTALLASGEPPPA